MATLAEVLRALATGTLPARDYTDRLLARIRAKDGVIRAFARVDPPRALALADGCDTRRANGEDVRPLHGLAVGVKDIFDTVDLPTEMGSPIFAERRPTRDAAMIDRLRAAGAFVLGKTATTELAYMHPAETRNPWNPRHTPGGSSAGSAAAVAAGLVHAAIGTQTNGSVIRPAAFCGVVGFKPTAGLLPTAGAFPFSPTLDQVGTFARTVADVALFTAALVEGETLPPRIDARSRAPVFGVVAGWAWTALEPEAHDHFVAVQKRLAGAGARLIPLEPPPVFGDANLVLRTIMLHEAARLHRDLQLAHRPRLSRELNAGLDEGRVISQATYGEKLARRAVLVDLAADLFAQCDAILSPPVPGPAPRRLDTTGDPGFCTPWSLVGFPAITVPTGLAQNGMPLGVQVAAPPGADASLLRDAAWIESVVGPLPRTE
jgi:Asp-tRNA(Asn)/Glu-tRNA(Gln) amidotransferase A subunit family amidase